MTGPRPRPLLIVVRSSHPATYEWLRQRYGGEAMIVEDRRERDRRRARPQESSRPVPARERRRGTDRRRPPAFSEQQRWEQEGYRFADREWSRSAHR